VFVFPQLPSRATITDRDIILTLVSVAPSHLRTMSTSDAQRCLAGLRSFARHRLPRDDFALDAAVAEVHAELVRRGAA
jgi:hypothetical protein